VHQQVSNSISSGLRVRRFADPAWLPCWLLLLLVLLLLLLLVVVVVVLLLLLFELQSGAPCHLHRMQQRRQLL
jgi:hypothetical protein